MVDSYFEKCKEDIGKDVVFILDSIRCDRSFLNIHFQNSMNNYFLDDYAGVFLRDHLNIPRVREIKKYIFSKSSHIQGAKYMTLLNGYIQELDSANQLTAFMRVLVSHILTDVFPSERSSKQWQCSVWKRAFSLFVHHACQQKATPFKGIFEIWNALFPNDKILRKREQNYTHRSKEFKVSEINHNRSSKQKTTTTATQPLLESQDTLITQTIPTQEIKILGNVNQGSGRSSIPNVGFIIQEQIEFNPDYIRIEEQREQKTNSTQQLELSSQPNQIYSNSIRQIAPDLDICWESTQSDLSYRQIFDEFSFSNSRQLSDEYESNESLIADSIHSFPISSSIMNSELMFQGFFFND